MSPGAPHARPGSMTVMKNANASERATALVNDLAMPDEDGYSLIRRVRESESLVPAVAVTAYVRREDEARVREAGFQRHVPKPFDPQMLVEAGPRPRTRVKPVG